MKDLNLRSNLTLQSHLRDPSFLSLEKQVERKKRDIQKKTLGHLEKQFSQTILSDHPKFQSNKDPNIATISTSYSFFHGSPEKQDQLKTQLENVTNGRNKLVHELFISFDLKSDNGLVDLDKFLEQQHKDLLQIVKELQGMREHPIESGKVVFNKMQKSEIPKEYGQLVCVSRVLACLGVFGNYINKDSDLEWTRLAPAKKYLNNHFPKALAECSRHYKVKSLKKILRKIGVFDVQRLATDHEKEMVYYRMKQGYSIGEDENGGLILSYRKDIGNLGGYWEENVDLQIFIEKNKT